MFQSFSSFTLFCSSICSSLLLIGELWLFFVGLFLLLSLSGFPLSLLLTCRIFSPCTPVFPLLCMHRICLVSLYSRLWLLLYILHIFFVFCLAGPLHKRQRTSPQLCTLFFDKGHVQSLHSSLMLLQNFLWCPN